MLITENDLERWKNNTLDTALEMNYRNDIIEFLRGNVEFKIIEEMVPKGMWFGRCYYGGKPRIEVYQHNLSTESRM